MSAQRISEEEKTDEERRRELKVHRNKFMLTKRIVKSKAILSFGYISHFHYMFEKTLLRIRYYF